MRTNSLFSTSGERGSSVGESGGRRTASSTAGRRLGALLAGNERHVRSRVATRETDDAAAALVVPCVLDPPDPGRPLWPVEPGDPVVTVPSVGNVTWERRDDARVLAPSVRHAVGERAVDTVVVVGHTACEAMADAYDEHVTGESATPRGDRTQFASLLSVVTDAFAEHLLTAATPRRTALHRLVEYNVVRQVRWLRGELTPSTAVFGYVHDQDGVYGPSPGRHYLVADGGERGRETVRPCPGGRSVPTASLLR